MEIDYRFVGQMLAKYHSHLQSVEFSINKNLETYERQRIELERLAKFKPETYQKELEKVLDKIKEADIKLSHVIPNIQKIQEQVEIIITK